LPKPTSSARLVLVGSLLATPLFKLMPGWTELPFCELPVVGRGSCSNSLLTYSQITEMDAKLRFYC